MAQQQLWEKGTALLDVLPVLKEARRLVRTRLCARAPARVLRFTLYALDLCGDRSHGIHSVA